MDTCLWFSKIHGIKPFFGLDARIICNNYREVLNVMSPRLLTLSWLSPTLTVNSYATNTQTSLDLQDICILSHPILKVSGKGDFADYNISLARIFLDTHLQFSLP